jgi:hypothetical protein
MMWPFGRGRAKRARTAADIEQDLTVARTARNRSWAELLAGGPRRPSAGWWIARRGEVAECDARIGRLVLEATRLRVRE